MGMGRGVEYFLLVCLCLFCGFDMGNSTNLEKEKVAGTDGGEKLRQDAGFLRAFRQSLLPQSLGALKDWEDLEDPCMWFGVECRHISGETRVVSLELWGLDLRGSLSPHIGKISELQRLVIVRNRFSGCIPEEIGNLRHLVELDLRANSLSGSIPFSLGRLWKLEALRLSENQLSGSLDGLFAQRRSVASLVIPHFSQESESAEDGGICPCLKVLQLSHNLFTSNIPHAIGQCSELVEVDLRGNSLLGKIPFSLGALSKLESLDLSSNAFDGAIPNSLSHCTKLLSIDVSDNMLSGEIPLEIAKFPRTTRFSFANNQLEGQIPRGEWSVAEMMVQGAFSGNPDLCGWPMSRSCKSPQQPFEVSPDKQGVHSSQEELGLSFTKLFCMGVARLRKLYVNVYPKFLGCLNKVKTYRYHHTPQVTTLRVKLRAPTVVSRPRWLAEADAPQQTQSPSVAPAPTPRKKHTARRWGLGLFLGLVAGAIAAAVLATILRFCVLYMHQTPYLLGPIIFNPQISPKMLAFLEEDGSLSQAEILGSGGTGHVYKAVLEAGKESRRYVAVKCVLIRDDQKGLSVQKQIQAELETLGCIRHRNLVTLLAYVHRPDCHLLVYNYMDRGSLYSVLQKANANELELPWPVRHRIAVGTASGLCYLHFSSVPRIVHRDLKPGNILLDSDYTARLADFGLAKFIPDAESHVTTGVAGTLGYIAPEYSQTWQLTDKSDVYSFGVVLAVLLTGKDPTDQFFQTVSGGNIGSWLHSLLQSGNVMEAIDPKLRGTEYDDEIVLAVKIAVFCTDSQPSQRPSIKDALAMLNQIREVES